MLQAYELTKRYGGLLALDRVSFELGPGEIVKDGEMSEWLSASAAKPLRRDISPELALNSDGSGGRMKEHAWK